MGLIKFDTEADNVVSGTYSQGRGPVLRSDNLEVTKISFGAGEGAETHQHEEEQVMYVLSGRLRVTVGDDTFEVAEGEASFHPSNVPHAVHALEDTVGLSLKNQVAPIYAPTGRLDSEEEDA
jgi:quercetin dioxygenase-like cupin family protein